MPFAAALSTDEWADGRTGGCPLSASLSTSATRAHSCLSFLAGASYAIIVPLLLFSYQEDRLPPFWVRADGRTGGRTHGQADVHFAVRVPRAPSACIFFQELHFLGQCTQSGSSLANVVPCFMHCGMERADLVRAKA